MQRASDLAERYAQRVALGLALAVLLIGAAYSVYLGAALRYPDERDYYTIATHVADTGSYTLDGQHATAARPPGYPFILAALLVLGRSIVLLRLANFVALGVSVYLVYLIVKTQARPLVACLAALLVLGYPILLYSAGTLYPQTIAGCLLLGCILLLFSSKQSWRNAAGVGLLLGFLILMIPTFVMTLAALAIWLWRNNAAWGRIATICAVALAPAGLWTARNELALHAPVFVATNSGVNLLLGNSEHTTPNGGVNVDIAKYDAVVGTLDEAARDRYYRDQALDYMASHPLRTAGLYLAKLANHFNYRNELRTTGEASSLTDVVMLATYGPLLLLGALRLALCRRYPLTRLESLLFWLYLANALASALFFTRIRFRLPFDYMLIMIAALLLGLLGRAVLAKGWISATRCS